MHTDSSSSGLSYCCLGSHQTGLSSETGSTLRKEIFLRDNIFSKMLKQARIGENSMVGNKIFNLFWHNFVPAMNQKMRKYIRNA